MPSARMARHHAGMDPALDAYYAMRELVLRHRDGRASEGSLAALRKHCQVAARASADAECAARLAAVEENAARLFLGVGNGNSARRRVLAELEHFRARLHAAAKAA